MEHLNEQDLLDLAGGHLPPERVRPIQDHLENCEACRKRHDQLQETWKDLGVWQVTPPADLDLTEAVLSRLAVPNSPWQLRRGELLRIAASVLIAVGLGHLTARNLRPTHNVALDENQQAQILNILGLPSATGLVDPLLVEDTAAGGIEP